MVAGGRERGVQLSGGRERSTWLGREITVLQTLRERGEVPSEREMSEGLEMG